MSRINRTPVNIDVPDFSEEPISPDDAQIGDALDEYQKRWLVIGICIHSVISPALRQFVAPIFKGLYQTLRTDESIDRQTYGNRLEKYPINSDVRLNYEAINNNRTITGNGRQQGFDYAVRNEVDLSKLFLQTHMAFHTGFDHTCDSSALLTFIIKVKDFEDRQKDCAKQFRDEIRNHWAHCNFLFWTRQTFINAFQIMADFVSSLGLSAQEETDINRALTEWRTNGERFLTGSTLGLEVVSCTVGHLSDIRRHVKRLAEQTKAEFVREIGALHKLEECLSKLEEELNRMKDILQHHSEEIGDHERRISKAEEILQRQKVDVHVHGTQIEKNKEDIQNIGRMMQNITQTNAHMIGNKYITLPCRRREFVDREEYLQGIKEYLLNSDQSENKIALCGLGGIGKTSIVIEYAWMAHVEHYQGGVFWLSGQNGEAFENSIRYLAAVIGTIEGNLIETQAKTFNWISLRQGRCLIVIDNVDEENVDPSIQECITDHVKIGQHNHVIITTRRSDVKAEIDFRCSKCITVFELCDSECVKLVKKVLRNESSENNTDIHKLCGYLYGLPLAIEQAATAIKLNGCMVSEYVREFQEKHIQLLNYPLPPQVSNIYKNKQSIWTTWKINIDNIMIKAESLGLDSAVRIMVPLFACLARDEITFEMINEGKPEVKDEIIRDIFRSIIKKRDVIRLFTECSVLTDNRDGTLRMHPLVQEFIQFSLHLEESEWRHIAECAIAMLSKACEEAIRKTDFVLFARLENQCVALKLHFERMDDIVFKIATLKNQLSLMHHRSIEEELRNVAAKMDSMVTKLELRNVAAETHAIRTEEGLRYIACGPLLKRRKQELRNVAAETDAIRTAKALSRIGDSCDDRIGRALSRIGDSCDGRIGRGLAGYYLLPFIGGLLLSILTSNR